MCFVEIVTKVCDFGGWLAAHSSDWLVRTHFVIKTGKGQMENESLVPGVFLNHRASEASLKA